MFQPPRHQNSTRRQLAHDGARGDELSPDEGAVSADLLYRGVRADRHAGAWQLALCVGGQFFRECAEDTGPSLYEEGCRTLRINASAAASLSAAWTCSTASSPQ